MASLSAKPSSSDPGTPTPAPIRSPETVAAPAKWLTKDEAARYLKVSPKTIQRMVAKRDLPFHRAGHALRLQVADLDNYMARSRVEASAPTDVPAAHRLLRATRPLRGKGSEAELIELGRDARTAGIHKIFKSRVEDAAYKAAVSSALGDVEVGGCVRIMSNSLRFLLLLGPQADLTLSLPMREALQRGVRFQLLLLDPDSPAARTRASVEHGINFAEGDERFYQTHLYRDIISATEALADPHSSWIGDDEICERLRDRTQVPVRYSNAEPTTHLVLTEELRFVENYHSGGDSEIQKSLAEQGIPDLHCYGGFMPVVLYDRTSLAGRLIQSHFEHSWDAAAGGPTIETVLQQATANGGRT